MKTMLILIGCLAAAGTAFAARGDTLRSFTLSGQPGNGVRGLAYDDSDGNVWAAAPFGTGNVRFCKFVPGSGSLTQSWTSMSGAYWVFDLAHGFGGNGYLVQIDQSRPRLRRWTTNGSYVGSIPDGGLGEGLGARGASYLYGPAASSGPLRQYNGSSWSTFAASPGPVKGMCYAFGYVWCVTTTPDYSLYYYTLRGSLVRSFPLNGWGTRYMVGLSKGRDNASGDEESVFIAVFYPSRMIYEVSVGDIPTGVQPTSIGKVKSLYR